MIYTSLDQNTGTIQKNITGINHIKFQLMYFLHAYCCCGSKCFARKFGQNFNSLSKFYEDTTDDIREEFTLEMYIKKITNLECHLIRNKADQKKRHFWMIEHIEKEENKTYKTLRREIQKSKEVAS